MSVAPASIRPASSLLRLVVLVPIALSLVGLQVALPWISYHCAVQRRDESGKLNNEFNGNSFWDQRLRFDGFLDSAFPREENPSFGSATVFQNELIILMHDLGRVKDGLYFVWRWVKPQVIRVDLATGRFSTSPGAENVDFVLSDGEKIWWLPSPPKSADPLWDEPLLIGGRPVFLATDIQDPKLHPLIEFVDGNWRNTERYVLLDEQISNQRHWTRFTILNRNSEIYVLYIQDLADSEDQDFYSRRDLEIGSEQQAIQFGQAPEPMLDLEADGYFRKAGWKLIRYRNDDEIPRIADFSMHGSSWFGVGVSSITFANWFEGDSFCDMRTENSVEPDDDHHTEIVCRCFHPDGKVQVQRIQSPIPWGPDSSSLAFHESWMRCFPQPDGTQVLASYDQDDGRIHVYRRKHGKLSLIAQRRSPLIAWICIDGATLLTLAFLIPMLVMGFWTWLLQRWQGQLSFSAGHQTMLLASGVRRGCARLIDAGLPVAVLVIALILNPDVTGWWIRVIDRNSSVYYRLQSFVDTPNWNTLSEVGRMMQLLWSHTISAPIPWVVYSAVMGYVIWQIVCQARTGRTLGKWLLGVKLLRTTLRPCGVARSLLREILLLIDTAMLLSWVPGALCILATRNSQRIGDLLADTIVVRDLPSIEKTRSNAE